jgi:hypothetical protein
MDPICLPVKITDLDGFIAGTRFFMWPLHEFPCLGERKLKNILQRVEETSLATVAVSRMMSAIRLILR